MKRVLLYVPTADTWLPVLLQLFDGSGFLMAWTPEDCKDYDFLEWDDEDRKLLWAEVRERWPELMRGDGQDYAVFFPFHRLTSYKEVSE